MRHLGIAALAAGLAAIVFMAAPAGAQEMVPPQTIPCTVCHDSTTLIVSKQAQFHESVHATGDAFARGASGDCAGCHGSEGSKERINAGLSPHDPSIGGVTNVSPYNCRTCHDIHTTYTRVDFGLTGDAGAVKMENTAGTFDGGEGNLCANCHQIRNPMPEVANGQIEVTNARYGTHHGVEASMLLGEGGLGVEGAAGPHYMFVADTCVGCHMGEARDHTFEPQVANCQGCHDGLDTFDRHDVQTEIGGMLEDVKTKLVTAGIFNADNGLANTGTYPQAVAQSMWNYVMVVEDQSMGVHNPAYTRALLQYALDNL